MEHFKITKIKIGNKNPKNRFKVIILEIICLILLISTIYLCFRNYSLSKQLSRYQPKLNNTAIVWTTKTDSKYMGKKTQSTSLYTTPDKFGEIPAYKGNLNPKEILLWDFKDLERGNTSVGNESLVPHTLSSRDLSNKDSATSSSQNPLSENPFSFREDSLVQILLDRKQLKLSSYNYPSSKFRTRTYSIDLNRYSYNWTPSSGLTYKKVYPIIIYPYIKSGYSLINKELDLNTGITISTNKLDFSLEGCLNNAIGTPKNIGVDLKINVIYKFKPWLR